MYHSLDDFYHDWNFESSSTIKYIENLTDESLHRRVTPEGRSLGFLAWHLATTIPELMGRTGLKVDGPDHSEKAPSSAKEIADAYKKASGSLIEQLKKNWNHEILESEDDMYGENWKKGYSLMCLINHQIHHRAQMSVLMRQAGLRVPGTYGPAKEDWAKMGMDTME
jgi:uncharacterized damage-inducible protein DinB